MNGIQIEDLWSNPLSSSFLNIDLTKFETPFDLPFIWAIMHSFAVAASTFSVEHLGIIHLVRSCAYQGVRNVSFSENFAYVLNEWSLMRRERVDFQYTFSIPENNETAILHVQKQSLGIVSSKVN